MSPSELLLQFLRSQPDTIRSNIYAQIHTHLIGGIPAEQFEQEIEHYIVGKDDGRISATVVVSGILDYVFSREEVPGWSERFKEVAEEAGSGNLMKLALGEPLRLRHRAQARENWAELRTKTLSHRAILEYEDTRLAGRLNR